MPLEGKPKLIFGSSMQALTHVARGRVRPQTERRLIELGLPLFTPASPTYPERDWVEAITLIAADLLPGAPAELQHRNLGAIAVGRIAEMFVGRAMIAATRILGVPRMLERTTNNLRAGANFIEARLTRLDETSWQLWISDVSGLPGFYAGLMEGGRRIVPGWIDEMRIISLDGASCTYVLNRRAPSRLA